MKVRFGDDIVGRGILQKALIRRPLFKEDGRHLMRTHTTTNRKQAAKMKDRRERRCGHRGGESPSFGDNIVGRDILMKKYNKIINLGVVVVL